MFLLFFLSCASQQVPIDFLSVERRALIQKFFSVFSDYIVREEGPLQKNKKTAEMTFTWNSLEIKQSHCTVRPQGHTRAHV